MVYLVEPQLLGEEAVGYFTSGAQDLSSGIPRTNNTVQRSNHLASLAQVIPWQYIIDETCYEHSFTVSDLLLPFLFCQLNTPHPHPLPLNTPDLEQVTPFSRICFLLTFIFGARKREHVWSLGSLFAASLSYQVSSYPDLYDSIQCEKLCAKLLTLSLVTQCCVLSRDLCSLGINLYFVRMVFSFQELGASAAKEI